MRQGRIDAILMQEARLWSTASTCSRLHVGAVLGSDGRSISSGFNGAPPGLPHCRHDIDASCEVATHAEENVIGFAARRGTATLGSTLYITHSPCYRCSGLIIAAGIVRVMYGEQYGPRLGIDKLAEAGIKVEKACN